MITTRAALDSLNEIRSRLLQTPEVFAVMLDALPADFAHWRPSADRWCFTEILKHLLLCELHVFRPRALALLNGSRPVLPAVDPDALLRDHGSDLPDDPEQLLDIWRVERAESLELLHSIAETDMTRVAVHAQAGLITLSELMHKWICHDFEHIRQVSRYAVWYEAPFTGPLRKLISDSAPVAQNL